MSPEGSDRLAQGAALGQGRRTLPQPRRGEIVLRIAMPHSFANVIVHLFFSTKNRRPWLKDPAIRKELHAYMGAILKALGFSKRLVLSLLLSESVMLAMGGALAGSLGAAAIFSVINVQAVTGGMFPPVNVTGSTILICAAIGALVGLTASGFPAWRASQVSVAEALRKVV